MVSTRAAELPADLAAKRRDLADDHQLGRMLRLPATVDPQALFDIEAPAAATEIPRRNATRAQDRAHAVSRDRDLDRRRQMEAHGISRGLADLLAALRDQLIGAAQFLAVVAEHQA